MWRRNADRRKPPGPMVIGSGTKHDQLSNLPRRGAVSRLAKMRTQRAALPHSTGLTLHALGSRELGTRTQAILDDGLDYPGAATDQLNYLFDVVPHTSDGAISHIVSDVQLWVSRASIIFSSIGHHST